MRTVLHGTETSCGTIPAAPSQPLLPRTCMSGAPIGVLLMTGSLKERYRPWEACIFSRASYYFRKSAYLEFLRSKKHIGVGGSALRQRLIFSENWLSPGSGPGRLLPDHAQVRSRSRGRAAVRTLRG